MTPRILFLADGGPQVGGGHVMRSLTLARALADRGAQFAFAAPPGVAEVLDAFAPDVDRIPAPSTAPADLAAAAAIQPFEAVVFDHFGMAAEHHLAAAAGKPALAIDDLADRPMAVDLLLDSGPARTAEDYAPWVGERTQLLLGPGYAPVRPEFAVRRPAAPPASPDVKRLLVSLGLTDVGGVTAVVVERLRRRFGDVALDVVVGSAAPSRRALEKIAGHDPRLFVHVDVADMAALVGNADAAIGAAGSSTWERCVLGLPSVMIVLADNQQDAAAALARRGAALVVDGRGPDFPAAFDRAAVHLITEPALRAQLAAESWAVCDGLGADRTAEAFLDLIAAREG